jgi:hypothetical protein
MKNIHILPTDKPSRLIYNDANQLCYQSNKSYKNDRKWMHRKKFNIYITSDVEIKLGEWVIYTKGIKIHCKKIDSKEDVELANIENSGVLKIILTTDQELIKNGIQPIPDDFLEWFVKNSSCERVEVKEKQHFEADKSKRIDPLNGVYYSYKIIIPKEEPKQETIEEAAERFYSEQSESYENAIEPTFDYSRYLVTGFIDGAKCQAERMYSEKEVRDLFNLYKEEFSIYRNSQILNVQFEEWFNENKKQQ